MKYILLLIFALPQIGLSQVAIDGDSFEYRGKEYRLACIDVVEYDHRNGEIAKQTLQYWLNKATDFEVVRIGYYDRYIVYVWADDLLVNGLIYSKSFAKFYHKAKCKYKKQVLSYEN